MIKILRLAFIIGLGTSFSFGQQYFPLVDSKAKWVETSEDVTGFRRYQHQMERDTTINDTNYKILEHVSLIRCNNSIAQANSHNCDYRQYWDTSITISSIGFIREDTSSKTIYYKLTSNDSEIVLYNFNMKVEDTVFVDLGYDYEGVPMIVKEKDSILVNNEHRNRFELTDTSSPPFSKIFIIEGIGSTCGLFSRCDFFEGGTILDCYKYGDSVLYGDCEDIVSISKKNNDVSLFKIQQSPSSLTISFGSIKGQNINLIVRSIDGTLLYSKSGIVENKLTIDYSEINGNPRGGSILTIMYRNRIENRIVKFL